MLSIEGEGVAEGEVEENGG